MMVFILCIPAKINKKLYSMLVSITEVSFAGKKRYLSFLNDNHALTLQLIFYLISVNFLN